MAATTEEVPRPLGRGTSSVVSFVVAINRVDVVELVVDLVDVDLDVDLVDVDLDVDHVDANLDVDHVNVDFVGVELLKSGFWNISKYQFGFGNHTRVTRSLWIVRK